MNGIFGQKKETTTKHTEIEKVKIADTSDIRDELWVRLTALEERVTALTTENLELQRKYLRLEQQYGALVLIVKALKANPEVAEQVSELLAQFDVKLNGG